MKVQNSGIKPSLGSLDSAKKTEANGKVDSGSIRSTQKDLKISSGDIAQAARVDLSPRAQDMKRIKEIVTNTPDVDMDKVAKFQKLIDEGNYQVDSKAVADRMVDEHLLFGEE